MLDECLAEVGEIITPVTKILAIDETPEVIESPCHRRRPIVIELPDKEAFRSRCDSHGYQRIVSLRTNAVDGWLARGSGLRTALRRIDPLATPFSAWSPFRWCSIVGDG